MNNTQVNFIVDHKLDIDSNYILFYYHIKYSQQIFTFHLDKLKNMSMKFAAGLICQWDSRAYYGMTKLKHINHIRLKFVLIRYKTGYISTCQCFLCTLSFECTTKFQVNFINQFPFPFVLKQSMQKISILIVLWAKCFHNSYSCYVNWITVLWILILGFFPKNHVSVLTYQNSLIIL